MRPLAAYEADLIKAEKADEKDGAPALFVVQYRTASEMGRAAGTWETRFETADLAEARRVCRALYRQGWVDVQIAVKVPT